ncbi:MAG: DMT family transporter [Candidatus Lokiarchaeota archaeon]|nr:DMT family transporter [Candidatus Lokiarchaeota archaeon]
MTGEIIAVLAVLTFVISNVLFRRTENHASPSFINFFRTAIGTLTFIMIAVVLGIVTNVFLLPWTLWVILFLSFLFGQVIGDTAYFKAQKELGTTIALAISMTFPLFTLILSLIFLNRPFEYKIILSIVLIGAGIIIIGKSKVNSVNENLDSLDSDGQPQKLSTRTSFISIGYALIASLGWAIGLVIIDYATNQIDQILITEGFSSIISNIIRFPFALLILLLMVWRENRIGDSSQYLHSFKKPSQTWVILLIGAFIGTSLGAYLYTEAARTAGAIVMSLLASASPLFSLPLTYWLNKERITKYGFLGVISTILGVFIILI